jgi:hypothetical protein
VARSNFPERKAAFKNDILSEIKFDFLAEQVGVKDFGFLNIGDECSGGVKFKGWSGFHGISFCVIA